MTPPFDTLVQDFFCRRLIDQQGASPRTVEAYRDTFRLLLAYLPRKLGKSVPSLSLSDLDAPAVLAFLDHLEAERGNGPRTRNARLAALRSFVQYAASRDPTAWPLVRRVLAIPAKRYTRPLLGYLTREEMQAVLSAPDAATWAGQRDRVLFAVMYNTGARVSEVIGLRQADLTGDHTRSLRIRGKGRKERAVPLWKKTAAELVRWSKQLDPQPQSPLFPNARGQPLSRSGVEDRLALAVRSAAESLPEPSRPVCLAPYDPAHDGDAPVAIRCRCDRHRVVARPRKPRDDTPIRGSRSTDERGGADEGKRLVAQAGDLSGEG